MSDVSVGLDAPTSYAFSFDQINRVYVLLAIKFLTEQVILWTVCLIYSDR